MSESQLWSYLRSKASGIDMVRVENPVNPGTPDVNYCVKSKEGWIELKYSTEAPKRQNTPVFDDRTGLSREQVLWISRRIFHGGVVWIIAGVGKSIFFISGQYASLFNHFNLDNLIAYSSLTFKRGEGSAIPTLVRKLLEDPDGHRTPKKRRS